jgi:glycosyltransferase involved in cell wall biosynthesis
MNSICVLFHRFGPYHWARLNAAGETMRLLAVETSGETGDYAWDKVDGKKSFERVTLFPDADSRSRPAQEVASRVRETLGRHQPAAVAIPGWSDKSALAALAWCLESGTPAIVMSESQSRDEARRWTREAVKRRVVSLCSTGLAGGRPHVDYLAALGMPRDRIFTGYDVVDNEYFAAASEAARLQAPARREQLGLPEKYFLASSRFLAKKNLRRLLEAYAGYRKLAPADAWKLVLLGDGPLREELMQQREALGLGTEVLLPGFQQYQELPAYYGLADAFVHASTTEQWGLVVNEAMACGLPVLVSDHCGCVPDLVVNGRNGFTFDPQHVPSLTERFVQLAGGVHDLNAMGRASREIIARWSPRTFANNLRDATESALERPRPARGFFNRMLLQALIQA